MKRQDSRTTVMIRHIPNKFSIATFLEEINTEFLNKYDVFYLPIDFKNNCNLGFAFLNFVDPMHIVSFCEKYRSKRWPKFKSEKVNIKNFKKRFVKLLMQKFRDELI